MAKKGSSLRLREKKKINYTVVAARKKRNRGTLEEKKRVILIGLLTGGRGEASISIIHREKETTPHLKKGGLVLYPRRKGTFLMREGGVLRLPSVRDDAQRVEAPVMLRPPSSGGNGRNKTAEGPDEASSGRRPARGGSPRRGKPKEQLERKNSGRTRSRSRGETSSPSPKERGDLNITERKKKE